MERTTQIDLSGKDVAVLLENLDALPDCLGQDTALALAERLIKYSRSK